MSVLEEPYRSRALPPGTARYWSWLFAARAARAPLLGLYALAAEWRALTDPALEPGVAQVKLAWWREELGRWAAGAPLHPLSRFVAGLPAAAAIDVGALALTLEAAAAQVAGVPLERAADLQAHADALYGAPLRVACLLAAPACDRPRVDACIAALAPAEYVSRALTDYRREARSGRVPFAVADLLAAGVDNDDLMADAAPPRLQAYLDDLRRSAVARYASAASQLAPQDRPTLRHLAVLGALGARHAGAGRRAGADFRPADLYNAWTAARRAAAGA